MSRSTRIQGLFPFHLPTAGALVASFILASPLISGDTPEAQVHVGGQFALASDSGVELGARLVFPLRPERLRLDGVLDINHYPSPGSGVDDWSELNLNARLPLPVSDRFDSRVGAGLNLAFVSMESVPGTAGESRTDAGLNLLAAVEFSRGRFSRGRVVPFLETRLVLGDRSQPILTGGVTLGSPRGR